MGQFLEHVGAFRFLDLPRELRDRIYSIVLTSERRPPASPEECGKRWREIDASTMSRISVPNEPERYRDIWYEDQPMAIACTGLLSCARQISQEMVEAIERQTKEGKGGLQYKLDCMVQGERLWPTWTALPVPLKYLRCLEFDFRDFTVVDKEGQSIKWIDKACVGGIVTSFLRLLGQFITRGPQLTCSVCNCRQMAGYSHILCRECELKRIKLERFDVKCVRAREDTKPLDLYCGSHSDNTDLGGLCGLFSILRSLADSALLSGDIDLIGLHCKNEVRECKIEYVETSSRTALAKVWAPYGWTPGDLL